MANYYQSSYQTPRRAKKNKNSEWLHLLLFYVLPLIVVNSIIFFAVIAKPKMSITINDTPNYVTTTATISIDSFFPTKSIEIYMDQEPIVFTKESSRTYLAVIENNGVLESTVTNLNGMATTVFETINILDDIPPTLENVGIDEDDSDQNIVTISVTDSQSGVNYDSIYGVDVDGTRIEPINIDKSGSTVSFSMDTTSLSVFVQDNAGNESQGNFNQKSES